MRNHLALAHLAYDGRETITLRLITECRQGLITPLWPTLEVIIGLSPQGRTNYAFFAIDVPTGVVLHLFGGGRQAIFPSCHSMKRCWRSTHRQAPYRIGLR